MTISFSAALLVDGKNQKNSFSAAFRSSVMDSKPE